MRDTPIISNRPVGKLTELGGCRGNIAAVASIRLALDCF